MTEELNNDVRKLRFLDEDGETYPDWEEKKLEETLFSGGSGGTPTSTNKKYYNGQYPFLAVSDITKQGKYLESTEKSLTESGIKNSGAWVVPANSLIYTLYASVGKMCINKKPITTSQALYAMTFNESEFLEYMYYALLEFNKKKLNRFITTGTQANINANSLKSFELPIPSLPEQTKIADFLSNLDERIEAQSKLVELLKKQKQGYSQRLFNGSLRFKKDDGTDYDDWEEKKLGELFTKYEEKIYVKDDIKYGQITVSKTGLITHRTLNFGSNIGRKRQFVINLDKYPNTLTFIRQGIAEGGIGIVPIELNGYVVTENMPLLSFNEDYIKKDYINQYIKSNLYYRDVLKDLIPNGSAQKAIHEKDWLNKTSIFPSLPEQEKIAAFLSNLDNRIDQQLNKLEQLKQEKQAYMQRVLG